MGLEIFNTYLLKGSQTFELYLLPPASEVCGKVMFLHASVILSMGGEDMRAMHALPAMHAPTTHAPHHTHTPLPCTPPAMHAPCHTCPLTRIPPATHATPQPCTPLSGYHADTPITIKAEPSIWPTAALINIHEHPI